MTKITSIFSLFVLAAILVGSIGLATNAYAGGPGPTPEPGLRQAEGLGLGLGLGIGLGVGSGSDSVSAPERPAGVFCSCAGPRFVPALPAGIHT